MRPLVPSSILLSAARKLARLGSPPVTYPVPAGSSTSFVPSRSDKSRVVSDLPTQLSRTASRRI